MPTQQSKSSQDSLLFLSEFAVKLRKSVMRKHSSHVLNHSKWTSRGDILYWFLSDYFIEADKVLLSFSLDFRKDFSIASRIQRRFYISCISWSQYFTDWFAYGEESSMLVTMFLPNLYS